MDGSPCPEDDERLVLELSVAEAMTVSAALRQYEPYWSANASPTAVFEQLETLRSHITSVIDKLRVAAAAD
ncbi:hypothetical protein [uncultured Jatrophihabitans sp.]|uniref:hypothetical protein n=1 Tax=uncultured Jatrophihabitans sp. TaxID=1610747 RepID=UPI0035CA0091